VGERLLKEIRDRIGFMVEVGLGYLTFSPDQNALHGEYQRITLADHWFGFDGNPYVLDEPSIGLHARIPIATAIAPEVTRGRETVVVVEHDPDVIRTAMRSLTLARCRKMGRSVIFQGNWNLF